MAGKIKTQLVIEGKNESGRAIDEAQTGLAGLSSKAKAAGVALAAAFSVGAIASFVSQAAKGVVQMARMAELSGATAQQFQQWEYAARSVGIEQEKLGDIFKDVQDKVGDFLQNGGGPLKDFFDNIAPLVGVTADQFRNLSGPDALQLYVSSLEKANVSQAEMTFYMEALANDVTLLLPLLRENGAAFQKLAQEAEEFGLILDSGVIEQAKQFGVSMSTFGAISEGTGRKITAELLPSLNSMSGLMVDVSKDAKGLSTIAGALGWIMKALATAVIVVASTFGNLGRAIGGSAAAASLAVRGKFSEAAQVMRDMAEDNKQATQDMNKQISDLWSGAYEKMGEAAAKANAEKKAFDDQLAAQQESHNKRIKTLQSDALKNTESVLKAAVAAEKKAAAELARVKEDRIKIEERYRDALAGLGGAADPSYGNAQALQMAAQQALASKDVKGAQANAQAALKMLQDLAAAGENTYGFEGFIQELKAIELAANDIEKSNADAKIKSFGDEIKTLEDQVTKLQNAPISVVFDEASAAAARSQIEALAAQLGVKLTIPVTIAADYSQPYTLQEPTGFATGGRVRGPGTGTSDSILARLSNGEFVMRAAAVRAYGPALLEKMNGLQIPRFAEGGLVDSVSSMPGPTPGRDLGRVDLNVGGESFSLLADGDQFDRILKQTARKFGRTRT